MQTDLQKLNIIEKIEVLMNMAYDLQNSSCMNEVRYKSCLLHDGLEEVQNELGLFGARLHQYIENNLGG